MARKRMFDSEIINQDSFYDLPMEAKAIYFLLGMEADDEGFVSPKKILRLYGGTEDSIKILILKKYIIPFSSGVIVITDWKRNNYLDKNRIQPTIYQDEKKQLGYDDKDQKYLLLNQCLTEVKPKLNQYRIEENSTEEVSKEENSTEEINDNKILLNEFEKLWKLYPKKVGKDKAFIKYKKYRTSKGTDYTTFDEVLGGLYRYLEYIKQTGWYSPKDGSTWFNNRCWNDEYDIKDKPVCMQDVDREEATKEEQEEMNNLLSDFR